MCRRTNWGAALITSARRLAGLGVQGTPNSLRDVGEAKAGLPGLEGQMDVGRTLPCPFCGSRSVMVQEISDQLFYVHCDVCDADGPLAASDGLAVKIWNDASPFRPSRYIASDIEGDEIDASCAETGESGRNRDAECRKPPIRCEPTETVDSPAWYTSGGVETIEKVEAVIEGLPAREAYLLGQVVRYVDRAGMKDEAAIDLGKANNYAHRLVGGKWRGNE